MQLINAEYFYPKKVQNPITGKYKRKKDAVFLVVKDKDGEKKRIKYESPAFSYYVALPGFETSENNEKGKYDKYKPREQVREVSCLYNKLFDSIVEELEDREVERLWRLARGSYDGKVMKEAKSKIHLDFRLHGTDMNIIDYYIYQFLQEYSAEENNFELRKWFSDIEVDSTMIDGFPDSDSARGTVNAISSVDMYNKVIYGQFLKYPDNEGYQKFTNKKFRVEFIREIKRKYKEQFDIDFKVRLLFYDEEMDLIQDYFDIINDKKPDFVSFWNADYDIPYLINRCKRLEYDPVEIMCPQEFAEGEKTVYYRKDNGKDITDRHSEYHISSYSNYIDEMQLFANVTKTQGKRDSYSLDAIAYEVVGIHKEEVEGSMKYFHETNYVQFATYSLQDSVALAMIDNTTYHIDLIYALSQITFTRVDSAFKKTVSIRNFARHYAFKYGYVASNNRASLYTDKKKAPGAFVAPLDTIDNIGIEIFGILSNFIFDDVIDLDLASLYPSLIRALNLSLETLVGTIMCDINGSNQIEMAQDYMTGDIVNFGMKYFNLPSLEDVLDECENLFGGDVLVMETEDAKLFIEDEQYEDEEELEEDE